MGRFKIPVGVKIFIGIWLLITCVPTVRQIPRSLVLTSWFNRSDSATDPALIAELARQAPTDAVGATWAAENASQTGDREALTQLVTRFPRDMSARALRLKTAERGRVDLKKLRADKDPKQSEKWLKFARFAREDGALEPENSFFPWMEAGFLYAARRDEAALAAIERVGNCARYQDYSERTAADRVAFLKRYQNVGWATKIGISSATLYPQLGWLHECSRWATKQARELRKSGDNARAIDIESAILHASFLLKRDAESSISVLTGQNIACDSLRTFFGIAAPKNLPPYWMGKMGGQWNDPLPHYRELAQKWSAYANSNGQSELAKRADFVTDVSLQTQISDFLMFEDSADLWKMFGLSALGGAIVFQTPAFLFLLALAIAAGATGWLNGTLWRSREQAPTRGQAMACANFSLWAMVGAIAVAWAIFIRPRDLLMSSDVVSGNAVSLGFLTLAVATWLLPVAFFNWRHRRQTLRAPQTKTPHGRKGWTAFGLWLIAGVSVATVTSNMATGAPLFDDSTLNVIVVVSTLAAIAMSWRRGDERSRWKWRLAHRSLGPLLVAWSVIFLLSALATWPLENQLNRAVDRRIQIGEIAWMREQTVRKN